MPRIATVFGVALYIYREGGRHHTPHVHARFAEYTASIDFAGNILEGALPTNKARKVRRYIAEHRDAMEATWHDLNG